ncbi:replicase polyprotein 1a [Sesbania bispinosa]|nr:replicase polyprotein 1a [Sesbania bispinosa]
MDAQDVGAYETRVDVVDCIGENRLPDMDCVDMDDASKDYGPRDSVDKDCVVGDGASGDGVDNDYVVGDGVDLAGTSKGDVIDGDASKGHRTTYQQGEIDIDIGEDS